VSSAIEEPNSTTEGTKKAEMLATLSPEEQERFAAYRRCALPADKVSKYIASSLVKYSNYMEQSKQIGEAIAGKNRTRTIVPQEYDVNNPPPLKDLVASDSSIDITITVSSLAKQYIQRLVKLAVAHNQDREPSPLQTEHILKAVRDGGMDEMFMDTCSLQGSKTSLVASQVLKDGVLVAEEIRDLE
jgi:hypothetical protein